MAVQGIAGLHLTEMTKLEIDFARSALGVRCVFASLFLLLDRLRLFNTQKSSGTLIRSVLNE
jgi:hypothetical protein